MDLPRHCPTCTCGGVSALPAVDPSGVRTGTLLLEYQRDGTYIGKLYRLPMMRPGVSYNIPLADLQPESAGLYDRDGTLIRELAPDGYR